MWPLSDVYCFLPFARPFARLFPDHRLKSAGRETRTTCLAFWGGLINDHDEMISRCYRCEAITRSREGLRVVCHLLVNPWETRKANERECVLIYVLPPGFPSKRKTASQGMEQYHAEVRSWPPDGKFPVKFFLIPSKVKR